jgi:hypothetical protein
MLARLQVGKSPSDERSPLVTASAIHTSMGMMSSLSSENTEDLKGGAGMIVIPNSIHDIDQA